MKASRRSAQQLDIRLADAGQQHLLQQAISAVPGFHADAPVPSVDERLITGIASLAIGDTDFTRALLEHVEGPAFLLLAARHYLWTGRDALFRGLLERVQRELAVVRPFAELHEVGMALESIGAPKPSAAGGAALLPEWNGEEWLQLARERPAHGVAAFVHGVLGAAADAPRGRLRLRPWLPADARMMEIDNLRVGDAFITLRYRQSPTVVSYRIEQTAGAIPIRLIFEPTFTRQVRAVIIDEVAAELSLQPLRERIVAPVQLVLDNERSVIFELQ